MDNNSFTAIKINIPRLIHSIFNKDYFKKLLFRIPNVPLVFKIHVILTYSLKENFVILKQNPSYSRIIVFLES